MSAYFLYLCDPLAKGEGQSENLPTKNLFYSGLGIFSSLTSCFEFIFEVLGQISTGVAASHSMYFINSLTVKLRVAHMLKGVNEFFLQIRIKIQSDFDLANIQWSSACLFICWASRLKEKMTCWICTQGVFSFFFSLPQPGNLLTFSSTWEAGRESWQW